ncbi:MAG: VOC family protein [Candidatus Dormibacteria bacterium]
MPGPGGELERPGTAPVAGGPAPPESIGFISAVLITSPDPQRLLPFYRDLLGIPLVEEQHGEAGHWACELGDVHFAIHPGPVAEGEGRLRLALWVFDLHALAEHLQRRGVSLEYPITTLGNESWVTAVRDPDGNPLELTQMGPGWLEHLRQRRRRGFDLLKPKENQD